MQTLDLSGTTPRSESRLKSLFWPSIETGNDVDSLAAQGYWVCAIVAVLGFATIAAQGHPIAGVFSLIFYYLGGVGVRERSRYAAAVVLAMFLTDFVGGIVIAGVAGLGPGWGVLRVLFSALLLSNFRATWISSNWTPGSGEAELPPRFSGTWTEKFVDRMPAQLWPNVRILYYIFSAGYMLLVALGLLMIAARRHG